jgi:hypothetical protein
MASPRQWIQENSAIVTLVTVLILALAVGLIWWGRKEPTGNEVRSVYFYDLTSKELFSAPSTSLPPIPVPSDAAGTTTPKGVRAYVFSCGDCGNAADRVVGWLEMYTPAAQERLAPMFGPKRGKWGPASPEEVPNLLNPGDHLVATSAGKAWVDANSSEVMRIRNDAQKPCPSGERPHECTP